ncbi:TIR-like protein FxsC [Solwaraspora sp. WMMD1047]|uniref:TIR-like protein FxsC n=1 Tax=Solwaraspora sp. WMMD1047 TaxID=3016102 RepID=UPI002416CABC|nr:TIR-like protein FxsC [Solwaraspora sp. WMMD1047]MDG4831527.1 TIR-like protein FxsC [Solwaraspora sp. WMMD1047]
MVNGSRVCRSTVNAFGNRHRELASFTLRNRGLYSSATASTWRITPTDKITSSQTGQAAGRQLGGHVHYFFLSYARGDEDELVQRFFEDLSTEVRLLAGLPRHEIVGFLDRTIQVGERWPRQLSEALATCRSFLALMTPRYFQSRACGREWHAFADRTARYESVAGVDSSLLKPLMWVPTPPSKMHRAAENIQYYSDALGETYQRLGIRQLMRLHRHRDDYRSFTFELATQIVASVESHRLAEGNLVDNFGALPSAFHRNVAQLAESDQPDKPFLTHIIVAALPRSDMRAVRQELDVYGDQGLDWAPYRPPLLSPLVEYACAIAENHSLDFRLADLSELSARAVQAHRDNQIILLLVDAWVSKVADAQQVLASTDRDKAPITAVLIPKSRDDLETRRNWPDLSMACREIFGRLANDDELYRSPITSHVAFGETLPEVLEAARNRVHSVGTVRRRPDRHTSNQQARVDGPWMDPG